MAASFLSVLPATTSAYLEHSDRSHTLRCASLTSFNTLCMLVVAPPGVILDANDRFLAFTGWRYSDIVHTSFEENEAATLPLSPLVLQQQRRAQCNGRHRQYLPQYPSAMAEVEALKRGDKRKGNTTWRCRMMDGTAFECESTFWGEWNEPVVKGQRRPPDRMVFVYEMDDAVIVDEMDECRILAE